MNILVTGGAGFIGYHTCEELLYQGYNVIILDDLSSGNEYNVNDLMRTYPERLSFFYGDVKDLSKWDFRPDAILHLAAKVSVKESIESPTLTAYNNIIGFVAVCDFAKQKKVPRVIYASSAAVYGDQTLCIENESCFPLSPYGVDKICNEMYARLYTHLYGIEFVGLRYFNVFGPYQNDNYAGVISKFISNIKNNEPLTVFGDGKQQRNFISVDDVAKINVHALKGGFNNFVLNVGNPNNTVSILDLINELEFITEKELKINFESERLGDIYKSIPDLTRLSYSYPDYSNMDSLNSGLRSMLKENNI